MYISAILLILFATISSISSNSVLNTWYQDNDAASERTQLIETVGAGIQGFYNIYHRYPNNLEELKNSIEFTHLHYLPVDRVNYANTTISDTLNDITYERFIIAVNNGKPINFTDYLSAAGNACGMGDFYTSKEFCGSSTSKWMMEDSKGIYRKWAAAQSRLFDTLSVFFYEKNKFPNIKHDGSTISNSTTLSMKNITGYAGSSNTCSKFHTFDGISFGCEAIFSVAGNDIYYQFESDSNVLLFAEMPFKKSDGVTPHYIVKELKK